MRTIFRHSFGDWGFGVLTETDVVGSDDWWLVRLASELGSSFEHLYELKSYRDGEAMLPNEAFTGAERDAYTRFMHMNRLHIVELLRDARTGKQKIIGFRTASPSDSNGDSDAWTLWKASHMPSMAYNLFNDVADFGHGYLVVDHFDSDLGQVRPSFRPVSPIWANTFQNARQPWLTEVAIEVGYDAVTGVDQIKLWRRNESGQVVGKKAIMRVGEKSMIPTDGKVWNPGIQWEWVNVQDDLPFSSVPVVRLQTPSGAGVWEKHLDSIDRVNYLTLQLTQIVVTQAFRQAAVSGTMPSTYPADDPLGRAGQPVNYADIFKFGPAALWRLPSDGKLQEFSPVDPTGIKNLRDDEIRKLAAFTSTPYYMLSSDSANNSAEGASLASDKLQDQVSAMNDQAEVGIALAMGYAFESLDDWVRADSAQIEAMWAPLRRASLQEIGSAASAAKNGGATQRWIDEHVFSMTPAERAQAEIDRQEEALLGAVGLG